MRVPLVSVAGFLALGAEIDAWMAAGLVMIGAVVGAASVVGLRAARRRPRRGANTKQRLDSLGSLVVENAPLRADSLPPSDRPETESGDDEAGFAERVAAILDHDEPRPTGRSPGPGVGDDHDSVEEPATSGRAIDVSLEPVRESTDAENGVAITERVAGAPRPIPHGAHRPIADSPAPVGASVVVESSSDPVESTGEAVLSSLTSDEVAMLFNRYEDLARDDLDALDGDGRDIDAEIWLDPSQGDAMPYIDTTRRTAEGLWVYLRSGQVICKMSGSDAWTNADDHDPEPTRPTVVVELVQNQEPIELVFTIVADPGTELTRELGTVPTRPR